MGDTRKILILSIDTALSTLTFQSLGLISDPYLKLQAIGEHDDDAASSC